MQSKLCLILLLAAAVAQGADSPSWSADNGNGTYSNPLFDDEFSGRSRLLPDRHNDANHARLAHLGPDFRLQDGKEIYGQGQFITLTDLSNGASLAVVDGRVHSVSGSEPATAFRVVDRSQGRIALQTSRGQYVSVGGAGKTGDVRLKSGSPGDAATFQWVDLQRGETLLLSLATHLYLVAPRTPGAVEADHPGPAPDRQDGSCFTWNVVGR